MGDTTEYLFEKELLKNLDLSKYGVEFKGDFSVLNPDDDFVTRPLSNQDYEKGFTELLSQLTKIGTVSKKNFIERFNGMKKNGDYYVVVVEDLSTNKLIATGMLEIEQKFIHSCALRGRVEEVIVDQEYRGRKLGKLILGVVTSLSEKLGCYKTTLECKTENLPFYEKFEYKKDSEHFMQLRFRE